MTFIQAFLEHTKGYESPTSFWKWSAYAAIAGVLRDNVWMADGDSRLYPNVYILFLAGSGQRKGRPISDAEHLVHLVNNVKVISGRSSIQAILTEIGHTETDEQGRIKKGGSAIFFAPELSAGIVTDDQAIQILTDIYDYKPIGHTTNLVGRGKSKLDKLIFSMLGGSNEELLKDIYSSKAIYGGLLGRTFLVTPDEFRPSVAFPKGNPERFQKLSKKLSEIGELNGAIQFNEEAERTFADWYVVFRDTSRKKDDRSGILGRLPTNVKKLSVILSANDLCPEVHQRHVEQAIYECLLLLPNYNTFIMTAGKSTIAECGAILLEDLSKGPQDRRILLRNHWQSFDQDILDKAIAAFETAQLVTIIGNGSNLMYQLTDKAWELLGKKKPEGAAGSK